MAKLDPYFGPHTGKLSIYIGPFCVGSGSFKTFEQFKAEFAGAYAVLGQSGTVLLKIRLADAGPANSSGSCEIVLNDKTDDAAQYRVNEKKLTFTTRLNDTPIDVYRSQGGTQVDGVSGHNFWIGK